VAKRLLEGVLSIGRTPEESDSRRSGRRVFVLAFIIATLLGIPAVIARFSQDYTWVGVVDLVALVISVVLIVVIAIRPTTYTPCLHSLFAVSTVAPLLDTAMFGGLLPSGLLASFGLVVALGALLAIDLRAGLVWFGVFVLFVVYSLAVPNWIDPIYILDDPKGNAAFNLITTGIVTMAVMIYFVHQRDRYQQRSDDLLHAILPDQIAAQLKDEPGTIADDVPSASVLFADVVGFTPMSASMYRLSSSGSWTSSSRCSTGSSPSSGWRRSRRWAMRTWPPPAFHRPDPITPTRSRSSRCASETTSRRTRSRVIASPCGSASTPVR
jgi:hypothetical protein